MIAACLYYSCRKATLPRFFRDIENVSSVSETKIKKCYKMLLDKLNLKSPSINPIIFISRFISDLKLSSEIEFYTIEILKAYLKYPAKIIGKNPKGICGAAIYIACKVKRKNLSQEKIAHMINTTKITLRARCQEIKETLNISF
jgi:transcription initiation factor TFIIIB Brf1 subunit/transcription initiation factor TFIIB